MTNVELVYLERRVRELREKIVLRESQQGLPTAGSAFGRDERHVESLRTELRNAAQQLVAMKYSALEILERMEAPLAAAAQPQVVTREPSTDDIKAAVREFLSKVPDDATVASLKELIQ